MNSARAVTGQLRLFLVVTFVGLFVVGAALRTSRGIGNWYRSLARWLLAEEIEEPPAFSSRPGIFGWLQTVVRDRTAWRAIGYTVLKVALSFAGVFLAFSFWLATFSCLTYPWTGNGNVTPGIIPVVRNIFAFSYFAAPGMTGFFHGLLIVLPASRPLS